MINNVAIKFQDAFARMDISSLADCISERVTYSALPSKNMFSGNMDVISFLECKFNIFRDLQAIPRLEKLINGRSEFAISLRYETLRPITSYAVNKYGIFMVVTLEPRNICMGLSIQAKCKGNKISKIIIFQKEIVKCRKTA